MIDLIPELKIYPEFGFERYTGIQYESEQELSHKGTHQLWDLKILLQKVQLSKERELPIPG